uniref:HGWP repeat containing protein-like n=1 Tax=Oryza sativa subsp. japonica TaxID=39947 RepID=Q6YT94_ORYSJ|nr:HGWP repeat containing protein-like [Oryza sativa Japonica Group]
MPLLLGVYVFSDRPPHPLPTGVSACTAGLYAAVVGRLRLHRLAASSAADWCFRLHGWPIMPPLQDVYIFSDRPPRMTPTGAIVFTAGHVAATANRHHHLQCKLSTSSTDWFLHSHGCMILPVLIGLIVFIASHLFCC